MSAILEKKSDLVSGLLSNAIYNPCRPYQAQHYALTLSSIDKYLSKNRHRVLGLTSPRAMKEESNVANRDWNDHLKNEH